MAMMLRQIWLFLAARWRPRVAVDGVARLPMRVWPVDLDINLHMNNGRYFSAADLGRMDWWLRTGIWAQIRARGWRPLAGDTNARFSRSLFPFEPYELQTRLLGWNDKWMFAEHRFWAHGQVTATVVVRYLFVGRGRARPKPAEVLELVGWTQPSPPLPEWVELWHRAQDRLSAELKVGAQGQA